MNSLLLDLTTALRFFARRRAAFAVVVATMALALGANTAVFSVLKAFVFAGLGVPESDRVMFVWTTREIPGRGRVDFLDAFANYQLARESTHFAENIAATLATSVNWEQADGTRQLQGARVQAEFFQVMRVQPVLGRLFSAKEEGPNAAPVAVISHSLWQSAFGGDPGVLGRTLRFNGAVHTIIGVLPARFSQPQATEVWLPFDLPQGSMWTAVIGARQLGIYARLAPGATVRSADLELKAFTPRAIEHNAANKEWSWRVQPVREALLAGADNMLFFVQAGALVLLVLAISNLAAVLLAWAAERQRETAVRLALGASGGRLVRQFLVQSILLVAVGGGLGILLAQFALPSLQRLNPNPGLAGFLQNLSLDRGALGFASLLIAGAGVLAGLLPAWQARRTGLMEALRSETRGGGLGRDGLRWQQAMVVVQSAIAVLILTGAALAGVGFEKLSRVQLGFATEGRAAFHLQFPEPAYATHEQRAKLVRTLQQNLARESVLTAFGITSTLPVGDFQWGGAFYPQLPTGEFPPDPVVFHYRRVSPDYLATMSIPLIEGRMLTERDRADSPFVILVSQEVAQKYWPGQSALGRKLRTGTGSVHEVVGVVGNVRDAGAGSPAGETVYVSFDQASVRLASVVLRGHGSAEELIAAGRRALRATAPEVAAFNIVTLDELAWQANALPRLQVTLLGFFSLVALVITGLGSYGVMSQLVANRQRELAVRAALGATRSEVLQMVLRQNARLAATGAMLGLGAAGVAARWLQASLQGFDATAVWPYFAVFAVVLLLTQLASYLPARRAANLDLAKALSGA